MAEKARNLASWQVKAVLEGRMTQIRVPVRNQPRYAEEHGQWLMSTGRCTWAISKQREVIENRKTGQVESDKIVSLTPERMVMERATSPFGKAGDRLWVRETWNDIVCGIELGYILYKADMPMHWDAKDTEHGESVTMEAKDYKWKPSIHMPRRASRINLRVKRVWVERVQEISVKDCVLEGVSKNAADGELAQIILTGDGDDRHKEAYADLWDKIYGNWDENPFVWCCEFEREA